MALDMTEPRRDTIARLVEIIGRDATIKLVRTPGIGGCTVVFSKGVRSDGQSSFEAIAEVVGEGNAYSLGVEFGGEPIYIPKCHDQLLAQRHAEIRKRFDELTARTAPVRHTARKAITQLAREFGASDRWLWEIVNRAEPDAGDGQTALF